MIANAWHPIEEWAAYDDSPGHIRNYADLWVVDDTGNSWREAEAWFDKRTGEWQVDDGMSGSDPISCLRDNVTPTHFMIVEGPEP